MRLVRETAQKAPGHLASAPRTPELQVATGRGCNRRRESGERRGPSAGPQAKDMSLGVRLFLGEDGTEPRFASLTSNRDPKPAPTSRSGRFWIRSRRQRAICLWAARGWVAPRFDVWPAQAVVCRCVERGSQGNVWRVCCRTEGSPRCQVLQGLDVLSTRPVNPWSAGPFWPCFRIEAIIILWVSILLEARVVERE